MCRGGCHHAAVIEVVCYGDDVPVPSFGPRMMYELRTIGADARPNWANLSPRGGPPSMGRHQDPTGGTLQSQGAK